MNQITASASDNQSDDMALLSELLGSDDSSVTAENLEPSIDGSDVGEIDLSLDELDMSLDEEVPDPAPTVEAAPAASGASDEFGDLDMDLDMDLDLDADAAALLEAVSTAEGVDSVSDLPAAAPAEAQPAEASAPAPAAPKKAAKPTTARSTYTNSKASEVLRSRLGGSVGNDLVLEFSDAELPQAELEAKQAELLDLLNVRPHQSKDSSTQKKVAEKVVMLFAYLKNGGKLNEVMARTFKTLAKDGYVQMGKTGNLFNDLLAKPYSPGTANAQGGQMMQMLPMLRIALPDPANKGRLVVNPESAIFARIGGLMGL